MTAFDWLLIACRACPQDARVLMLGVCVIAVCGPWVVAGMLSAWR